MSARPGGIRKPCAHPGCSRLVALGQAYCERHRPVVVEQKRARGRRYDQRRGDAPWRKWYKLARWKRLRQAQLNREPLCRYCLQKDVLTSAEIVDHILAHKGDPVLFWSMDNLQSLCKCCHDGRKQAEERAAEKAGRGPQIAGTAGVGTGEGRPIFARDGIHGGVSS